MTEGSQQLPRKTDPGDTTRLAPDDKALHFKIARKPDDRQLRRCEENIKDELGRLFSAADPRGGAAYVISAGCPECRKWRGNETGTAIAITFVCRECAIVWTLDMTQLVELTIYKDERGRVLRRKHALLPNRGCRSGYRIELNPEVSADSVDAYPSVSIRRDECERSARVGRPKKARENHRESRGTINGRFHMTRGPWRLMDNHELKDHDHIIGKEGELIAVVEMGLSPTNDAAAIVAMRNAHSLDVTDMARCFSCGAIADVNSDFCHGCDQIVCNGCSERYGHHGNEPGSHGRIPDVDPVPVELSKRMVDFLDAYSSLPGQPPAAAIEAAAVSSSLRKLMKR